MHKVKLSFLSVLGCIVLVGACGILALIAANPTGQVLTYSTFLGGKFEDPSRDIAVDTNGFAYVVGETRSTNFPITDDGSINSKSYDVFVAKFDPSLEGASGLIWSVVIGGSGFEKGVGIALDEEGNVYAVGSTSSSDFPSTDETGLAGNKSIFMVRLDENGLWQDGNGFATIIGQGGGSGPGYKDNVDIMVDSLDCIYLTGNTGDPSFFAIHGDPLPVFNGGSTDAFVAKFSQTGDPTKPLDLEYGTFIGGSGSEHAYGIAVDGSGNSYIAGGTDSFDFPTFNGLQSTLTGTYDAFVVKLDATGLIKYSTYLGGNEGTGGGSEEIGLDIAVDTSGIAYVAGRTSADDFPTKDAFDSTHSGGNDVFFVVLNPNLIGGASLLYSTYLGGGSGERGVSLAVDVSGNAYVFGRTLSNDFPTTPDAFDTTFNGKHDDFLAKLNPALSGEASLVSSTFWGGIREDAPGAIALHPDFGDISAYLSGSTGSRRDFPITSGAYDESYNAGQTDAFLSILAFQEVQPPDAPAAPSDLIATVVSCSEIALSWQDNSDNEDGFKIERSLNGDPFNQIDTVGPNVTSYSDTTVAENATYNYQIRAYNTVGNSDYSDIASDMTPICPVGPPVAPTDLTAKVRGKNKIALKWKDNSNNEDGFAIERSTDSTNFTEIYTVGQNTTSYLNTGLQSKILYYYRVRAYNQSGNSDYSNTASARTK